MNCPNCAAPMHLVEDRDYFICEYCSTFHFPRESPDGVRVLGQSTDLRCPVCGSELVTGTVERHLVKTCPNCHGVLARQRAFAIIVDKRRSRYTGPKPQPDPIRDEDRERRLDCPSCGRPMDAHPYLGPGAVLVDTCPRCTLIWLDRGEISTIERA